METVIIAKRLRAAETIMAVRKRQKATATTADRKSRVTEIRDQKSIHVPVAPALQVPGVLHLRTAILAAARQEAVLAAVQWVAARVAEVRQVVAVHVAAVAVADKLLVS